MTTRILLSGLFFFFGLTTAEETDHKHAQARLTYGETGVSATVTLSCAIIWLTMDVAPTRRRLADLSSLSDVLDQLVIDNVGGHECFEKGLKYHIHEKWEYGDSKSEAIGPDACGPEYTGGHWDPWLGCGPATGNLYCGDQSNFSCVTGSSVLGGDDYDCSPDSFESNPYACEIGDWNGKYGLLMIDNSTFNVSIVGASPFEVEPKDLEGLSIVFHCNDNSRAFCARFDMVSTDQQHMTALQNADDLIGYIDNSNYVVLMKNGSYLVNLDSSSLDATCSGDLLYRVMNSCEDDASFYDPTASCAPGSDNEHCIGDYLCGEQSYEYICNSSVYQERFSCAPGDLSGKYGSISTSGMLYGNDEMMIDLNLASGKGLAVQCSTDYSVMACATLESYDGVMADMMSSTMVGDESSDDDDVAFGVSLRFGFVVLFVACVEKFLV